MPNKNRPLSASFGQETSAMTNRKSRKTSRKRSNKRQKSRPTIGVLIRGVSDEFSAPLWNGAADAAREQDANLIGFIGGMLRSPQGFEAQGNVLYDLVGADNLDGLLVWTGILGHYVGPLETKNFCDRYRPLPMVSMELPLEGIPSVLLDFHQGMRSVIAHLIEVHGCRRIAFIRGPEDSLTAEERYRIYADTLAEYDIPLDLDLVAPGTFFAPSGAEAMRLLLDERQVNFEAVVAANDNMALDALRALQARGLQVPGEVAVAGFDDVEEAKSVTPPLTTVRVPFYEWGRRGVQIMLAQLRGEKVPELEHLPVDLVVRQSCGCMAPSVSQAAVGPVMTIPTQSSQEEGQSAPQAGSSIDETFEAALAARRDGILSEMVQMMRAPSGSAGPELAEQLLDAFIAEFGDELPGGFLSTLDGALRQVVAAHGDVAVWQGVLSALRRQALPYLVDNEARFRAENLWGQARVMIGEVAQRVQAHQRLQEERQAETLREIGQALITTPSLTGLKEVLAQELPRVGIKRFYLSLYAKPKSPAEWSSLILACDGEEQIELEPDGQRFPSRQLVPTGLLPHDRRYSLIVEPLYFMEDQLGFAVFEASPRAESVCDTLRGQISSALREAILIQEAENRALQLRTAAEVSRAASSILAPNELIQQVVDLVQERFGLYYVGLFLVDETGEWTGEAGKWAVLRAGTGEPGRQMLTEGHKLEIGGESMIGWCVANQQARIALDVGEDAVRFGSPHLPQTRSEMALPLISRGRVIGAVTVQSAEEAAFGDEDIAVLQTMADQVAVAIENVRLLAETQKALEEARAAHQHYLRQEWESFLTSRRDKESVGYVLTRDGLKPMPQVWSPEIQQAMQSQQPVVVTDTEEAPLPSSKGDGDENIPEPIIKARSALAVPISLRGQVIGALDIFDPDQPREWSDDDLALVDAVTSQVAVAVENARLFEQTQAALAETESLYRASRRITASIDLPALYQVLVDEMATRLGADQCQLTIFDHKTGSAEIVAEYRSTPDQDKTPVPMASNPFYVLLRDAQQPLSIIDVNAHPVFAHSEDTLARKNVESMLLIPISVRGELIGSLEIDSVGQRRVFTEAELDFCQTLASQAAITMDSMRTLEEQKETAKQLREMDKLKTQFLANMSHELRTPLNSIIGFSRVILKGIDGPLTELQQTDLTAIYNSGQHLLGLINDILDLSKIEAGKMELNFDEVDLKPIIKGVMSSAVGLVKDKPIELEQRAPEDLPMIWADSTRLRQVLLNLVSNATKFTESGKITLTADHDDEWVTIKVTDTGVGIPEEKLESIFEEFTQVDGSTTRAVGGTGLGLPISRHFIEMHGGQITVESEVDMGSTFMVILPIHAPMESEEADEDQPEERPSPERRVVVAVDDDPGVISLYRRYLEGEGYQIIGVTNSEEVLDKVAELQPFAVTLDILMPTKDGWQVLRELKECPETQDIPIIICSIVSNEGLGFSLGAADYLVKPIMEEELLAALERLDRKEEEALVLVIDDQADDILLIRRILEAQQRYQVIEADGGQAGIDMVHHRKPHIIILDLMMPGVDGFAVLEEIKRNPDTRRIPVIVITAKTLTKEEQQRLTGQVEALLHKGIFTEIELLEDLKKALSRIESNRAE